MNLHRTLISLVTSIVLSVTAAGCNSNGNEQIDLDLLTLTFFDYDLVTLDCVKLEEILGDSASSESRNMREDCRFFHKGVYFGIKDMGEASFQGQQIHKYIYTITVYLSDSWVGCRQNPYSVYEGSISYNIDGSWTKTKVLKYFKNAEDMLSQIESPSNNYVTFNWDSMENWDKWGWEFASRDQGLQTESIGRVMVSGPPGSGKIAFYCYERKTGLIKWIDLFQTVGVRR